ncbi:hypothetical protein EJB05_33803, partial [Eragrostis curvula]
MAVLEDSDGEMPLRQKLKRARSAAAGGEAASQKSGVRKKGAKTPAAASAPVGVAAVAYIGEEDADALDCGVCFQPLKPPIFQCNVGHVVCSLCRDKLKATGKCHVCGISTGDYSRCHDMERLLECIRIKCPNASYGCTASLRYCDKNSHCRTCPHAPCHCPGEGCSFIGSTTALWDHFAGVHGWSCTSKIRAGSKCTLSLHDGFNFLLANCDAEGGEGMTATPTAGNEWLFLLNVVRQPLDRAISMLCIHPHAGINAKEMECSLMYSQYGRVVNNCHGGDRLTSHYQNSSFRVACTDLSHGLPNPNECFQFVVPNSAVKDHKEYAIQVVAQVTIK